MLTWLFPFLFLALDIEGLSLAVSLKEEFLPRSEELTLLLIH
jgi:hypothetical protein